MKKFSVAAATEQIEFQIGEDTYVARPANRLPGSVLISYVETIQEGRVYKAHVDLFAKSLVKESADLFLERLEDGDSPITLEMLIEVAEWLTEQYSAFAVKAK